MKKIIDRVQSPTPTFFKKLRNTRLTIAAVAGSVLAAPVALSAVVVKLADCLVVAGDVLSGTCQTAKENE